MGFINNPGTQNFFRTNLNLKDKKKSHKKYHKKYQKYQEIHVFIYLKNKKVNCNPLKIGPVNMSPMNLSTCANSITDTKKISEKKLPGPLPSPSPSPSKFGLECFDSQESIAFTFTD